MSPIFEFVNIYAQKTEGNAMHVVSSCVFGNKLQSLKLEAEFGYLMSDWSLSTLVPSSQTVNKESMEKEGKIILRFMKL